VADNEHETLIAEVFDDHDWWRANARLIAAAPELLAVCKFVLSRIPATDLSSKKYLEQAIARAKGR